MGSFPPELRDLVIDCLGHDTPTLCACSLTCKAWLPRARHNLFRAVRIHPGRRGDAFKTLLETTPAIGSHIRDVSISGVGDDPSAPDLPDVSGRWPTLMAHGGSSPASKKPELRSVEWLHSVLPSSTDTLARVEKLSLFSLPITPQFSQLLGSHFRGVTAVTMDACRAETFGELLSLPRGLTEVEHLSLDGVTWYRPTYIKPTSHIVGRRSSLKSLTLTAKVDVTTVINWLVDQSRYTSLSSLSVYLSSDASATAVHSLLNAVGSSLRYLSIGFSDVRDPTVVLKHADFKLESLTGLHRLHMQCMDTARFSTVPSLSWILLMLSRTNSTQLSTLQFSIAYSDLKQRLNLEGLSVILCHKRYSALQRVVFDVEARHEQISHIQEELNTRLSFLIDKGVRIHAQTTFKAS